MYVNCVSTAEARKIGRMPVEQKMAASANIFNQTLSYYWWEEEHVEDPQTTLIFQCRTQHLGKLVSKIKAMHTYSVPCKIALPIGEGSADFID
ncbi:MAG: divalent-cation tolerance protein CutA [Bacteroidia bacterium]